MSYKPRTLFRLLQEINSSLFLPHIQRPFVWDEDQMLRLFDSLMRNYPIQTFLFWRTKNKIKARKFMSEISWDADLSDFYAENVSSEGFEKIFVLDGQQRIQTLFSIFNGSIISPDGNRREAYFDVSSGEESDSDLLYNLKFSKEHLDLPWYRVSQTLGKDSQRNYEEVGEEINDSLASVFGENKDRDKRVRRNIAQLFSLLREEKHFWVQELDGVASEYTYDKVLDIFVRVNSGGTKLNSSDLMFAAMKEGWDEIEEVIEETTELLNGSNLSFDKSFPLKCLLVAHGRGSEASPEKFSGAQGDKLLVEMSEGWSAAESAFQQLRDFMQRDIKIYADKVIRSYNSFIPIFDYLFHNPKPNESSRAFMRAYHYKAQLFGWYSQSTDAVVNALHSIVGKSCPGGFPIEEIKEYFQKRGNQTELTKSNLTENRLRHILLNIVYVDQFGSSPFDVKFKGNEPHVDHIYPQYTLRNKLGLLSADINHIGNFRFVGQVDNIRKRAESPAAYFSRLKSSSIDIGKHLLLADYAENPQLLTLDASEYSVFRDRRATRIWEIVSSIVNAEGGNAKLY